jgi:glycyl-tRNA synthetase alpha chain
LSPVAVELTYGIERIAMFLFNKDSVYELPWVNDVTYGDVFLQNEVQWSHFNFEEADVALHHELFTRFEAEAKRLCERALVLPAYDYVLKCSHTFNLLDARGAISVAERQGYIGRVRALARRCAEVYLAERERLGFPLSKAGNVPAASEPTHG